MSESIRILGIVSNPTASHAEIYALAKMATMPGARVTYFCHTPQFPRGATVVYSGVGSEQDIICAMVEFA